VPRAMWSLERTVCYGGGGVGAQRRGRVAGMFKAEKESAEKNPCFKKRYTYFWEGV
jgi:hypothetical protein